MKTVDDWRARFKKSSNVSAEIRQTETAQIQPELRIEPHADKNVGVDNLQSHKSIQPHSNEIFTSKIGVVSSQTPSWLQHQTSASCFGNLQTQPKLHSEASSDKFSTSRSGFESLQTHATGVLLQKTRANDRESVPTQSGLHTEPSPEKSKPSVKPPQAQTGCQLQMTRADSFGNLRTQPKLHSEGSSDKIVTGASGIESLQTQTGPQPQRACANVCESTPTQPAFHTEPSSDKRKSGGKHVQAQPRLQLQTTLENSFVNLYGQPKLHTEHGSDKMSTSRSGVESLQSQFGVQLQKELTNDCESKPTQLGFHTEPPSDKRSTSRSGVESLQSQSGVQLQKELANDCESKPTQSGFHAEPSSDKRNGVECPQAQPGLQLQTCANSAENLHTQQKLHTEGISDKINVVQSLQTQTGSQSLGACANNCESVPILSGFHTKPTSDKRNGAKHPQAQPGLQLRTTCANSFGNRNTPPKLHTEHSSDKINVAKSLQAQTGLQLQREHAHDYVSKYTQPGFHISDDRNVVKNFQAQTGLLLQRACANGHNILRTQPGPHTKPCSNKSSLGPATGGNPSSGTNNKLSPYELASSSIGSSHLVSLSNNNFSSRGPTEDSINATPIISTPAAKEKRFMLEDKSILENRLLSTPNLACLPKSDAGPLQLRSDSQVGGKKRDSDLHRLIFMENGLPDGSQLSYRLKGEIKLRGEKVKNGIKCSCCNEKVTPSKFELHAGHQEKRQPYKHIYYDKADLTLHELCLSLMSGQRLSTNSANLCMVCGCGGDLVPCDQCQKASHAGCLKLKCGLDGELHCPYCKSRLGNTSAARFTSSSAARPRKVRLTRMIKDTLQELGSGCVLCKTKEFTLETFCAETIIVCHQCEKEYHVGCLRFHGRCDLKAYPGKWFCCSECNLIHAALRTIVFHGPKVVPESLLGTLMKELGKPTNELGVEIHWQLLGGQYQPSSDLLPKVAAIFQEAFNPIIKRGHDLIHTMILGKSEAGECYEGMFSAVLIIESVIVSAGILRIFGTGIAELPLVATRRGSQGKGYFRTLLFLIERLLSRLKVEVLMVPVACDEQSWWIKKFGFKKMTEERWTKYASEIPLLSFETMTVLEKAVPRTLNDISYDELFTYAIVDSELSSMDTATQP